MILRGFNSASVIVRGFKTLVVVLTEHIYKWCTSVIQQVSEPITIRVIKRKNKIKQITADISTVTAYFKRK